MISRRDFIYASGLSILGANPFTIAPLSVPGAAAGVKDTLTAELRDENVQRVGALQTKQIIF